MPEGSRPTAATLAMLLLTALLTLLPPQQSPTPDAPDFPRLSAEQVAEDVALARRTYETVHPGYDRYTPADALGAAWDQVVTDAERADGMGIGEFYVRLSAVLAEIRCDHTKAELSPAQVERRESSPVYLPIRWDVVEGRGIILASADARIAPRSELLAVDGVPVAELVERYAPLVPIDGFTEGSREGQLGFGSEWRGGAIEHFAIEEGRAQPQATLEVRAPGGVAESVVVDRLDLGAWRELVASVRPFRLNFADAVHFERVGEDAALLRIDTFVNYRQPVRPDRIYDPIFRTLQKEGRTKLILDLRQNGGGSADAQVRLFAHLIDRPSRLVRDVRTKTLELGDLREHLTTWDKRALNPRKTWFRPNEDGSYSLRRRLDPAMRTVRPDRWAFDGEIVVLTSRDNASAVSTLLAKLGQQGNVTLVGEPTGGSAEGVTANILLFLKLPHSKIVTRVPAQRIYNDVERFEPGLGVSPDILVRRTADDAFAGEDPAMARAVEMVTGR